MKKKGKWIKIGCILLLIFFLLVVIDRILFFFELQSTLYYIGYVYGIIKGFFSNIFL